MFGQERLEFGQKLTVATLAGLAAGVVLGSTLYPTDSPLLLAFGTVSEAMGRAWVQALRMTILPLVVALLVVATISVREHVTVGRLGVTILAIFLGIYILGAATTLGSAPVLIEWSGVDPGALSGLGSATPEELPTVSTPTVAEQLTDIVPTNPFDAAVNEDLVQVVFFVVLFGLAVGRLDESRREPVVGFFQAVVEAMMVIVGWLLWVSPVGIFAVSLEAARQLGFDVAGVLLALAAILSVALVLVTLLLYPLAALIGGVSIGRFARGVYPGQVVGASTRSSLAALPALVEGARTTLRLPESVVGFALPFAAATFKPNRLVTSPVRLLFLAHVYGIHISMLEFAGFAGYIILLSAATLGIPRGGGGTMKALPAYVALGIPVEGYVLSRTIDVIWDFFATILNATGYSTVGVLLARFTRMDEAAREEILPQEATA